MRYTPNAVPERALAPMLGQEFKRIAQQFRDLDADTLTLGTIRTKSGETAAVVNDNAGVSLWYDNGQRLITTLNGADISPGSIAAFLNLSTTGDVGVRYRGFNTHGGFQLFVDNTAGVAGQVSLLQTNNLGASEGVWLKATRASTVELYTNFVRAFSTGVPSTTTSIYAIGSFNSNPATPGTMDGGLIFASADGNTMGQITHLETGVASLNFRMLNRIYTGELKFLVTGNAGAAVTVLRMGSAGAAAPTMGFFGAAPVGIPTVAGAKGGNAALGSLMAALVALNLVIDTTTP